MDQIIKRIEQIEVAQYAQYRRFGRYDDYLAVLWNQLQLALLCESAAQQKIRRRRSIEALCETASRFELAKWFRAFATRLMFDWGIPDSYQLIE